MTTTIEQDLRDLAKSIARGEAKLVELRQQRDDLIATMRSDGRSLRQIGAVAGLTPEMVRRLAGSHTDSMKAAAADLGVTLGAFLRAAKSADIGPDQWRVPLSVVVRNRLLAQLS